MQTLKQTPLYQAHIDRQAKMVDFGGWNMPIQYNGILEEHKNTRMHASLFDVSHMGEFIVKGEDAEKFLQFATTNNVQKLYNGKAQYSALLNTDATFIDDIIIYKISDNEYQICVNASNIEKDFLHLQTLSKNYKVELKNISDKVALIAIQGPKALSIMQQIFKNEVLENLQYYEFKKLKFQQHSCIIARMGYTGEDGFEWFMPSELAGDVWNLFLQYEEAYNLKPAGLGARDTLRLEMGFSLYGNDIDNQHTPTDASLRWIVDMKKEFYGKEFLQTQKPTQKLIAFKLLDKGVPRPHYEICSNKNNGEKIGMVTSGTFSPMLNIGIGLAYLNIEEAILDNQILIDLRGKKILAQIVRLPFYQTIHKK